MATATTAQRVSVGDKVAFLCSPESYPERPLRVEVTSLDAHGALLAARARRVVDAHGDLRPEHVCLTPRPVVIDCLEFQRAFRLLDPADELAYFAMECARLGNAAVGDAVMHQVLKALRDAPDDNLIRFYKVFRATLRAKISIWHLAERRINHAAHWRSRAREYLTLAQRYAPLADHRKPVAAMAT